MSKVKETAPVKAAAPAAKAARKDTTKLVKVIKDGETLEVHPTTVDQHVAAGWTVVGGQRLQPAQTIEEIEEELGEDGLKDA